MKAVIAPDPAARSRHDFLFKWARKDVALQPAPNKSAIFSFFAYNFFYKQNRRKVPFRADVNMLLLNILM